MNSYLGIDGGGTRTRALLVDESGTHLYSTESGPANLNSVDETTVRTSLRDVLKRCIEFSNTCPSATCLGLAGASAPAVSAKYKAILSGIGYTNFRLSSDAEIALDGAFPNKAGILLIAGTGSVCLGKDQDGNLIRTGGWGPLVDDVGSAAWLGKRGLEIAIKQHDHRIPGTTIRDALFKELGIGSTNEIVPRLYQPALSPAELAALAGSILGLAEDGDCIATDLLDQAARELAMLVQTTAASIGPTTPPVATSGGLLEHNPAIRAHLQRHLDAYILTSPERSPVAAAATKARHSAQS